MAILKKFEFHNAETSTASGNELTIQSPYEQMLLDIQTDATTLTVNFEAQGANGNWIALKCYNHTTATIATSTVLHINEIWQVDLIGLKKFRATITVQTGGTGTTIIGTITG